MTKDATKTAPVKTHANEPIDAQKELHGSSRAAGDAPPEVQQKIIDIIIEEARKRKFNNRDIAYYIAIAKRESGFNPDAANPNSTASGVAQVVDDTGKTFHIDDRNRFNARASIQAGLDYFALLKAAVIADFGSASGIHEPLIYYCYHYGQFSTRRRETVHGKVLVKEQYPIDKIAENNKYADSKSVLNDAIRIEEILNDTHALKVQLTDILGKPMAGRKAIVVQKKPKATPASSTEDTVSPATPSLAPDQTPTPAAANAPLEEQEKTILSEADSEKTVAENAQPTASTTPASCDTIPDVPVEWELVAREVTTDSDGNLPDVESASQEPFVILIPRIDYEAYNEAISKRLICEYGNDHQIQTHDGEQGALPAIKTQEKPAENKEAGKKSAPPLQKEKSEASSSKQPPSTLLDAAKEANEKPPSPPSRGVDITFEDVVTALQKDLGWENVYKTSFAYIKQFFTRPKLPATTLSPETPIQTSPARTQAVGSSLHNKETKTAKVKDKVTTATVTAEKEVSVAPDAPWMTHAVQEQSKSGTEKVKEIPGTHTSNAKWKEKYKIRSEAEKSIRAAREDIRKEARKPEKTRDSKKMGELEQKVKGLEAIRDQADVEMQDIEREFNNPDIVKYLQSTSMDKDAARNDATPWCASFANWCIEKSGYHGTGNGAAESWLHWGKEIREPKYGAITITTRASNPVRYHVGFFLGFDKKKVSDGEEEIEVKGKNGKLEKRRRKKYRDIDVVRLLSGNYSNQVLEGKAWAVLADDDPVSHLVAYRWPTDKEKK